MQIEGGSQVTDDSTKRAFDHIVGTYSWLRWALALVAIFFPLVLWLWGKLWFHIELQGSLSAYYHASTLAGSPAKLGAMRDVFVGSLFALATLLIAYRGYDGVEDWLLNGAGFCCLGIALFPMGWGDYKGWVIVAGHPSPLTAHGIFAFSLFGFTAATSLYWAFRGPLAKADEMHRKTHIAAAVGMVAFPAYEWFALKQHPAGVFWAEVMAFACFTLHWGIKTREISQINFETKLKATDQAQQH